MRTHRRTVASLAGPAVTVARQIYTHVPSDAVRVAALVEISAAAARLARTVVRLRRLDPDLVAPHVVDPVDLRAVLGRGRWLPTMTGHTPKPPTASVDLSALLPLLAVPSSRSARRRRVRRAVTAHQGDLFAPGDGGTACR